MTKRAKTGLGRVLDSTDVYGLWKTTGPGVILTLKEAHMLYELLKNAWIPTTSHEEIRAILKRLRGAKET